MQSIWPKLSTQYLITTYWQNYSHMVIVAVCYSGQEVFYWVIKSVVNWISLGFSPQQCCVRISTRTSAYLIYQQYAQHGTLFYLHVPYADDMKVSREVGSTGLVIRSHGSRFSIFSSPGNDFLKFRESRATVRQQAYQAVKSPPVTTRFLSNQSLNRLCLISHCSPHDLVCTRRLLSK